MATTDMFTPDEECDCYIRITAVYQQALSEMTAADAQAEGGYTLKEFEQVWDEIVGEYDPEAVVDVVEFEYVGHSRPSS